WDIYLNGDSATTEDGIVIESGEFTDLNSEKAREKMTTWLEENKLGERKINYRLRDWLVSRQRYWGAPIPIIYCDKCGEVPVPEKDLPVVLPTDVDFKPTGESPLAISKSFHDVACPVCGERARRESDTMDTFVCSSWYYLRFADPKNNQEFAAKENLEKWLPVDLYMGGAEHTVLHLLYARFFTKALAKYGYVKFDEPFLKLRHQGMIMAEDGRKMSKSLGNVVNPDEVVDGFGADALRIYEMFMGPIDEMKAWSMQNVNGPKNFLDKVWKIFGEKELIDCGNGCEGVAKELPIMLHKTIKKVTNDIEGFNFNTAISQMMIFINEFSKHDKLPKAAMEKFLILLAPFAPHMAEEIWSSILGHEKSIFLEKWPEFKEELTKDEEVEMVVQVNGKIRDRIRINAEISEEEAKKIALESEKVKVYTDGKELKKVIYVKGKLVSIVA
ncbi:MAG: Leucine-tRNA ligase, partial [Candidatus Moranbacteria bacterium GW2011_GWF1_35_5]